MKQQSLEERKKQSEILLKKFSQKVPIILYKNPKFPNLEDTIRKRLLIDKNMTLNNFFQYLGKHCLKLELTKSDTILDIKLYSSNNIEIKTKKEDIILSIYEKYKDEDGFLYINYSYEYIKKSKELNNETNTVTNNNLLLGKIPIILEKHPNYPYIKGITKNKFLIAKTFSVSTFIYTIQKKYLDLNEIIGDLKLKIVLIKQSDYSPLSTDENLYEIFEKYADKKDGYLYLYYYYDYTFKNAYKKIPLEDRKDEYENLVKTYKNKLPVIIEKNPNFLNIKSCEKKKFLLSDDSYISDIITILKNKLELKPIIFNTQLRILILETINNLPLSEDDKLIDIYNKYKEEEGFLYLQYIYEYNQINDLQIYKPISTFYNKVESRKHSDKLFAENKIPIVIEKYPSSELDNINKKYIVPIMYKLSYIKECIEKLVIKNKEDIKLCLITENNIDLRYQEQLLLKEIYTKYINENGQLYLYYLENSLLPELDLSDNNMEIINFKKLYSLEERKKKYKKLKKKHPKKILIRVEKEFDIYENNEFNNNKEEKLDKIFVFNPNTEIDSLKIKIWKKIGKPFLTVELLNIDKKIIQNYTKIIDLYHNFKDKEDDFVYLFYTCYKPNIDNEYYQNINNMSDATKICLLFKRIPFIFKPSTSFSNSNTQTKVFLPYKSKTSTFKDIQTNKKIQYYIDYPKQLLDLNESMLEFYMKNKNKKDDYLYLIIDKA